MKTISILILAFLLPWQAIASAQESKTILVHYMPWFSSKPASGQWGWHWTMKNCDPDKIESGQRNIASHYYPLIGPYDSNDADALECHALQMKFAGIDGVVIDWYGIEEHWDYAINHRNSEHLVKFIKKAGLKFAVCYEDQTVKHLIEGNVIKEEDQLAHGEKVVGWLAKNWFPDDAYVKLNGKPVMLVFGPQHFKTDQLKSITATVSPSPLLFTLPHLADAAKADGVFGWPPVDGGKLVSPETWNAYLKNLGEGQNQNRSVIPAVFPQFHDFYQQGEGRESYGSIEHRDGKTFEDTLELALESSSPLIQIATWNDFGEGTMIEPTVEFGYQFLESVQSRPQSENESVVKFNQQDLRLPVRLYLLRKRLATNDEAQAKLTQVSDMLFAGQCDQAKQLMDSLTSEIEK